MITGKVLDEICKGTLLTIDEEILRNVNEKDLKEIAQAFPKRIAQINCHKIFTSDFEND